MTQTNVWRSRLKKAALLGLGVGALALAHRHRATVRRKITDFKERSKDAYNAFQTTAKNQLMRDAKVQEDDAKLKRRQAARDAWNHRNYGALTANQEDAEKKAAVKKKRQEDAQKKADVKKKTWAEYYQGFLDDANRHYEDAKLKRRQQDDALSQLQTTQSQAVRAQRHADYITRRADDSQADADRVQREVDNETGEKNFFYTDAENQARANRYHEHAYHLNQLKRFANEFADHYNHKADKVSREWYKENLGGRRRTRRYE